MIVANCKGSAGMSYCILSSKLSSDPSQLNPQLSQKGELTHNRAVSRSERRRLISRWLLSFASQIAKQVKDNSNQHLRALAVMPEFREKLGFLWKYNIPVNSYRQFYIRHICIILLGSRSLEKSNSWLHYRTATVIKQELYAKKINAGNNS